jgi:hypothetical protein
MFNFNPFKIPTYSEWKEQVTKFYGDVAKFYKDWYSDIKETVNKDG